MLQKIFNIIRCSSYLNLRFIFKRKLSLYKLHTITSCTYIGKDYYILTDNVLQIFLPEIHRSVIMNICKDEGFSDIHTIPRLSDRKP